MSENKIKNYGRSVRSKLLNVSKETGVFYQTILTRYFQERLLYRISQTQYKSHFLLKGGALMYVYERYAARPTLDIDFLGKNISNDGERIKRAFMEICSVECPEDGITFDVSSISYHNITEFKDYHGIRLSIPVSMDTITQTLSMDIGFGDVVTPSPVNLDYPLLIESLPQPSVMAYSVETVIAEKMQAVVDLTDQNSRLKDYFDLYTILSNGNYNKDVLAEAVVNTFHNRHTSYDQNTMFFRPEFADNTIMQTRWNAFLRKSKIKINMNFAQVVGYLQRELKPYWENLKDER